MRKLTLKLVPAFSEAINLIDQARSELQIETLPEFFLEILQRLFSTPGSVEKLFRFQSGDSATAAGELLVTLQPTDLFLDLAAAITTRDFHLFIVKHGDLLDGDRNG